MTNLRAVFAVVFAVSLLPLAACARATVGASAPAASPSHPVEGLALRVASGGGFAGPGASIGQLPLLSVYGDGRVVTEGPTPAVYPGPALPNVQVQHISRADVTKLVRLAVDAGAGAGTDLGVPKIGDASTTTFSVLTGAGLRTTQVTGLREARDDTPGLTDAQRAARATLGQLLDQLTDLPKTLGPGAIDEAKPFEGTALAALARRYDANGQLPEPLPSQVDVTWPGPALPGAPLGAAGLGCVVATGDVMGKVLSVARSANTATRWMSGGTPWSVTFRPLLPDESGCADLVRR